MKTIDKLKLEFAFMVESLLSIKENYFWVRSHLFSLHEYSALLLFLWFMKYCLLFWKTGPCVEREQLELDYIEDEVEKDFFVL